MSSIKHFEIELPAYWASALTNNDWSGIRELDKLIIKQWLRDNPNACVESCSDESYIGRYDGLLCDLLTYEGYYIP